jgi:hypothetical protein
MRHRVEPCAFNQELIWSVSSVQNCAILSLMTARLTNAIYSTACIAAVLWALLVFAVGALQAHPDWTISTPIALVGAVVIWIIGRAARYLLIQSLTTNNRAQNLHSTSDDAN